jgi:LacI family transcriptional regulator
MIGAVIPELGSKFSASILMEIEDILRRHGIAMLICDCRSDPEREREAFDFLIQRRVDGYFNIPVDETGVNLQRLLQTGKPVIMIDRKIESARCSSVCVDNKNAMRSAVRYLAERGHKRIGLIAGPPRIQPARQRQEGFQEACREFGIECGRDSIYIGDDTMTAGVRGIGILRERHPDLTALLVSNHQMSVGAIIGLNEQGVRIPDEMSIIGFDNPDFARACHPKLTIVNQPVGQIGRAAAEMMLRKLESEEHICGEWVTFDTQILEGRSVADLTGRRKK